MADLRTMARDVLLALALAFVVVAFIGALSAKAHDPSHANAEWYSSQSINEPARKRMGVGYRSCCDAGDHFPTKFRIVDDGSKYGTETYEYFKDGAWRLIPPDIIQHKKTPDGQPVLFISKFTGAELCFIIDETGI